MDISQYVKLVNTRYQTGIAREHSYRADLQNLLHALAPQFLVTNEPARIACGAPDYIITKKNNKIDVGYIEAKDVGKSLDDKSFTEQFERYRKSLTNLIITDYLEFRLYREGDFVTSVKIAELKGKKIQPIASNFEAFSELILEFSAHTGEPITSSAHLAKMMAGKARLLANVIELALNSDEKNNENTTLQDQMQSFRTVLLHDLDARGFSDIYAQTIAYGMFAARLHDDTPKSFTRQEAAQLIPQTNPFLRKLFQYISGYDIDSRIEWIVDALADVFRLTDVSALLKNFGKASKRSDPMIHFYEEFLSEYDSALRRSRGVWYTPEPVVRFIVAAVDDVLKADFGLSEGLADTGKTTIKLNSQVRDKNFKTGFKQIEADVHKVQILDPATGTGTFLAEIIRNVHNRFTGQAGLWSKYVEDHLIPRLNGFEILMASYAMAHLKLDLLLRETGFTPKKSNRFQIYLTNSLEEHHPDTGTLFASWLSTEANEANHIKRDTPVMVVLGNPPYSRHSINKGHWLGELLNSYKKEPGTSDRLDERNSKWLNDDYVKFMRYAQHFVEKSGFGVVAFITNHGFIDNPTFRGMRWNLLGAFDRIHVIDLHGNSNIDEFVPADLENENVFDIKQGVAITIAVRTGSKKKNKLAEILHHDVYGSREQKYKFLDGNSLKSIPFDKVSPRAPYYFFKTKKYNDAASYDSWPSLSAIFSHFSTGYYTSRDDTVIAMTEDELKSQVMKSGLVSKFDKAKVRRTAYRPFDYRQIYFDEGLLTRARKKFVDSLPENNVILISGKSTKSSAVDHFYISDVFSELKCGEYSKGSYMFPLYCGSTGPAGDLFSEVQSNIKEEIIAEYRTICGKATTPHAVMFYIYSVLYSDTYRHKFRENLRDDFAHIPYPKDPKSFGKLCANGARLFDLHRMSPTSFKKLGTEYPIDGANNISRSIGRNDWEFNKSTNLGRAWINDEQYFDKIPRSVWEYQVGGYMPAQKWLKDRKGHELSYEEIVTYQRIIVAIRETLSITSDNEKLFENYF